MTLLTKEMPKLKHLAYTGGSCAIVQTIFKLILLREGCIRRIETAPLWEGWAWLLEAQAQARLEYWVREHHLWLVWCGACIPLFLDRLLISGAHCGVSNPTSRVRCWRLMMRSGKGLITGETICRALDSLLLDSLVLKTWLRTRCRSWGVSLVGFRQVVARVPWTGCLCKHATEPLLLFNNLLKVFALCFNA